MGPHVDCLNTTEKGGNRIFFSGIFDVMGADTAFLLSFPITSIIIDYHYQL